MGGKGSPPWDDPLRSPLGELRSDILSSLGSLIGSSLARSGEGICPGFLGRLRSSLGKISVCLSGWREKALRRHPPLPHPEGRFTEGTFDLTRLRGLCS
jgi:hypothetical protein